jgi:hypothetical protein
LIERRILAKWCQVAGGHEIRLSVMRCCGHEYFNIQDGAATKASAFIRFRRTSRRDQCSKRAKVAAIQTSRHAVPAGTVPSKNARNPALFRPILGSAQKSFCLKKQKMKKEPELSKVVRLERGVGPTTRPGLRGVGIFKEANCSR